jgi:transcriptional regulator with XRE-family HTH domain
MLVATSFARRLAVLREAARYSQYELARRSGMSKQALSSLELGKREPTWQTVRRLARALGVSVAAFDDPAEEIEGVQEPEPPARKPPVLKAKRPRPKDQ